MPQSTASPIVGTTRPDCPPDHVETYRNPAGTRTIGSQSATYNKKRAERLQRPGD
jgi:hypothetical protein